MYILYSFPPPLPLLSLPPPPLPLLSLLPFSSQLHSQGREYCKLKAAHMKLLGEVRQRESQLALTAAEKERVVEQQRNAAEAHLLQETRLQTTISQQIKLINYLQSVSASPRSQLKLKKVGIITYMCVHVDSVPIFHVHWYGSTCMQYT